MTIAHHYFPHLMCMTFMSDGHRQAQSTSLPNGLVCTDSDLEELKRLLVLPNMLWVTLTL